MVVGFCLEGISRKFPDIRSNVISLREHASRIGFWTVQWWPANGFGRILLRPPVSFMEGLDQVLRKPVQYEKLISTAAHGALRPCSCSQDRTLFLRKGARAYLCTCGILPRTTPLRATNPLLIFVETRDPTYPKVTAPSGNLRPVVKVRVCYERLTEISFTLGT